MWKSGNVWNNDGDSAYLYDAAGQIPGEEARCQYEESEDAESEEELQVVRGRVPRGIGCHCNGIFVGDLIIVEFHEGGVRPGQCREASTVAFIDNSFHVLTSEPTGYQREVRMELENRGMLAG